MRQTDTERGESLIKRKLIVGLIIGILWIGTLSTMGCIWGEEHKEEEEKDMWDNIPLAGGWQTEWIEKTINNDYQLLFTAAWIKLYLLVENVTFAVYDLDGKDVTNGYQKVSDVYGKPIDDDNNFSFGDGDHDGYLTIGDRFILKSRDHMNDDGKTSPGPVEEGFVLELRCGPDGKDGRIQLGQTKVK